MKWHVDAIDAILVVGLITLGAGLGGYDWRLAMVVIGALLVVLALVSALRAR